MTAAAAPSAQKLVLLVEDDPSLAMGLCDALEFEGFRVVHAARGADAIEQARKHAPDCILLDLMLPDLNGYQVCEQIRRTDLRTPILMLTARGQEADKIRGLDVGADDYVTKPFSPRELLARVKAVLRRSEEPPVKARIIEVGGFEIDSGRRAVVLPNGESVEPTAKEFDLLWFLAENAGLAMSRGQILERVWGYEYFGETRTVDVHIRQLRKKLPGIPIETVWGVGYRLGD